MSEVIEKLGRMKKAYEKMRVTSTYTKNKALEDIKSEIKERQSEILAANKLDIESGEKAGLPNALLDRLRLDEKRIDAIISGIEEVKQLPDPVGEIIETKVMANGLEIQKVRIPLGVIGMIYESRPNVTVDAACLAIKSGNCILLRGGEEADNTNQIFAECIKKAILKSGLPENCVDIVETLERSAVGEMLQANGYIDVLIPRGGHGLISRVVKEATVPVIQTGEGNCHIYVDKYANFEKALKILINGKVQRPSVCNAIEKLLVDCSIAKDYIPLAVKSLLENNVEVRGCERTISICPDVIPATADDWSCEYLSLTIAIKIVDGIDEAISHINKFGTKHSEVIITDDYSNARLFTKYIDAAAAYVNASSRFTDGQQFGLGAEIGISTQNLHVRGPMGLRELTTNKFVIFGDGQIRE